MKLKARPQDTLGMTLLGKDQDHQKNDTHPSYQSHLPYFFRTWRSSI